MSGLRALALLLVLWSLSAGHARAATDLSDTVPHREPGWDSLNVYGPTLIGLVEADGLVAWAGHAGQAAAASPRRPDLDTRWVAPGASRLVTALLAGVLARWGELDLEQPIGDALGVKTHADLAELTVASLISGQVPLRVPRFALGVDLDPCCFVHDRLRRPGARRDEPTGARRRLATATLSRPRLDAHDPRDAFELRHPHGPELGALVLAAVMEYQTGRSWEALVEELVLSPLGLGPLRHGPDPQGPPGHIARTLQLPWFGGNRHWIAVRRDAGAWRPAGGLQLSGAELARLLTELVAETPTLSLDAAMRRRVTASGVGVLQPRPRPGVMVYVAEGELNGYRDRIFGIDPSGATPDDSRVSSLIFHVSAGPFATPMQEIYEQMKGHLRYGTPL